MKKPASLLLLLSSSLVFSCGIIPKKQSDDTPASSPSAPSPEQQPGTPSQNDGASTPTTSNGSTTGASNQPGTPAPTATVSNLPVAADVHAYGQKLKSQFDLVISKAKADISSSSNAPTSTYYQVRTSRQLMSIVLDIKTYEKTGKSLADFKSINQSTDQELTGTSFVPLYQSNEKGLISLLAAYSKAVDKTKYMQGLASGTSARSNFADIENSIPTAVLNSGLALRDAVQAEQGLNVAAFYDSRMSAYNSASMNIHRLHNAIAMRSDVALLMLGQVNASKAKSLRDVANAIYASGPSGYQVAQLWSQLEMDALTSILEFYTK